MWLIVASKPGRRLGGVGPLGKTLTPPKVILRNRMKLRQVERNQFGHDFPGRHGLGDCFHEAVGDGPAKDPFAPIAWQRQQQSERPTVFGRHLVNFGPHFWAGHGPCQASSGHKGGGN